MPNYEYYYPLLLKGLYWIIILYRDHRKEYYPSFTLPFSHYFRYISAVPLGITTKYTFLVHICAYLLLFNIMLPRSDIVTFSNIFVLLCNDILYTNIVSTLMSRSAPLCTLQFQQDF